MKRLLVCLWTSAALVVLAGAADAAKVKRVLLKVPLAFGTQLPGLGTTMPWIAERIGTASNGTIKMKIYEPNKLVAPFEILDAVSTGKVNASYTTAGYWAGKIPASPLTSIASRNAGLNSVPPQLLFVTLTSTPNFVRIIVA